MLQQNILARQGHLRKLLNLPHLPPHPLVIRVIMIPHPNKIYTAINKVIFQSLVLLAVRSHLRIMQVGARENIEMTGFKEGQVVLSQVLQHQNNLFYDLKKFFPICIPSKSVILFFVSCA